MAFHLRACLFAVISITLFLTPLLAEALGQGGNLDTLLEGQQPNHSNSMPVTNPPPLPNPNVQMRPVNPISTPGPLPKIVLPLIMPPSGNASVQAAPAPQNPQQFLITNNSGSNGIEVTLQVKPLSAGQPAPVNATNPPMSAANPSSPPVSHPNNVPVFTGYKPTNNTQPVLIYSQPQADINSTGNGSGFRVGPTTMVPGNSQSVLPAGQLIKILNNSVKTATSVPSDAVWGPPPNVAQYFTATQGSTLLSTLQKFAQPYGWTIVSDSKEDLKILLDQTIVYKSFEDGLKQLIDGYPVQAKLYLRNKVAQIIFL